MPESIDTSETETDDPAKGERIAKRMARSMDEISHWEEYDYVLVNTRIEETHAQIKPILAAERLKRHRQEWLKLHVERLKEGK